MTTVRLEFDPVDDMGKPIPGRVEPVLEALIVPRKYENVLLNAELWTVADVTWDHTTLPGVHVATLTVKRNRNGW